jgi:rhodanese-related sulfurtransferase
MAKHSSRFVALVQQALQQVREVSVQSVHQRLQRGEVFHLIDVREESEWQAGHVPQAVHLSRGILERDIEARIPDTAAEIVLYCGGGYRSALAAESLQKMGYTNVWSMAGGFRGWCEAGLPVTK